MVETIKTDIMIFFGVIKKTLGKLHHITILQIIKKIFYYFKNLFFVNYKFNQINDKHEGFLYNSNNSCIYK